MLENDLRLVGDIGVEPITSGSEDRRSIQLKLIVPPIMYDYIGYITVVGIPTNPKKFYLPKKT